MKLLTVIFIAWNVQDGITSYKVYNGKEQIAIVNKAEAKIILPINEVSVITVTAFKDDIESEHSEAIKINPTIKQSIQSSKDLINWQDMPKKQDNFF